MISPHDFKEFVCSNIDSDGVWLSRASDLTNGSRVAVAVLEEGDNLVPIKSVVKFADDTTHDQSLIIRHLSQIEHVYGFRGAVDCDRIEFLNFGGDVPESSFSEGSSTEDHDATEPGHEKCYCVKVQLRCAGVPTDRQISINGTVNVESVRDDGSKAANIPFKCSIAC